LETPLKSFFYLFVRVNAVLCTVNEHIVFQYNERIIQQQRFSSVIQPCYLNINKLKTKDVHGVRYGLNIKFTEFPDHVSKDYGSTPVQNNEQLTKDRFGSELLELGIP
jgi:hypothetical protein